MAIIYSYPLNDNIKRLDELVGTTEKIINGQLKTVTRNFLLQDLAEFFIVDGGLQKTITLTTEGSSGASTLDQVTGVLNIPQYSGGAGSPITIVNGNSLFSTGLTGTGTGATGVDYSIFLGEDAGQNATNAANSNFLGRSSGQSGVDCSDSNFFGNYAGNGATSANNSNFLGEYAGNGAIDSQHSNFFGYYSGNNSTNAYQSNFFGQNAGRNAIGAYQSNFLGNDAGSNADGANNSNLLGYQVGMSFIDNNIGSNNIIIGTNISLPDAAVDSINLGGVLFGTGTYSTTAGDPSIVPISGGKIGIGVVEPTNTLHIYSEAANTSGLRLERLTSASPSSTGKLIGVDSSGNVVTVTGGGGGSQDLQSVTDEGETTTNNIQFIDSAEVVFGAGGGILLDNTSRLREGTIDAGLGGSKGIAQICAVGYELKWEAGRLYVMNGNGNGIRESLYNFNIVPTVDDDNTKAYYQGSLWSLDNGDVYECSDATTGAAVWFLKSTGSTPTLQDVTDEGATTTNGINIDTEDTYEIGLYAISSAIGIKGESRETYGVYGTSASGAGVYGASDSAYGVEGYSEAGVAVYGNSQDNIGVQGNSVLGTAISAYSEYGTGLYAASESNVGVSAYSNSIGLEVNGNGTIAIDVILGNSNKGLVINSGTSSTGNFIELAKNSVNKLTVNQQGEITATKLIKDGGTSSQILAADGSVITAGTNITITGGQISSVGGAGGGGSSVNYYLNGGTSQGTFGGTTYYEFSKTAVIGTGADFNISSNGYIASFITDVADPSLLLIPAGNWNLEFFFSSSSAGGSPSFYVELYKYDGTTFTLIASGSAVPEGITNGTAIDAYFTALAVPETVLTVNDRLAIRVYVNASSKTITLHTQNGYLCEVITTFTSGLTALNGLQAQVQNFAVGTSGTDFAINSSGSTHTFNLPTASASNRGALSSANWTTFNNKQDTLQNTVNIKSINGNSILGSGDLTISASAAAQSAYTILANNTNASAVPTAQVYKDIAEQSYTGSPTWSGTAPTTILSNTYKWNQVGSLVTVRLSLSYNVGGSNATVIIPLPTDLPTPASPTGFTGASDILYYGVGMFNTSTTAVAVTPRTVLLRRNSANNGYEFLLTVGTAISIRVVHLTLQYFT